tara:strand:+ start:1080 stop:1931 length:852 start_codon:yes stop_codon:yes gene_type:complete
MFTVEDNQTGKKIGSYIVNVSASSVVDDLSFVHGYGFYSNPNDSYTFRFVNGYARGVYNNLKIKDPLEKIWVARQIFLKMFPMTEFKKNNNNQYKIKLSNGKIKTVPQNKWLDFVKKNGFGLSDELESHPFHKQTMTRSAYDKRRFRIDKLCSMIDMGILNIIPQTMKFSGSLMVDSILVDKKGKKVSLRQAVDMWDKKFKGHKINRPQFKSFKKAHSKQVGDLIMPREYDLLKKAKGKEVFLKGGIYQGELKLNGFYSLKDVKKTKEGYRVPFSFDKYNLYV